MLSACKNNKITIVKCLLENNSKSCVSININYKNIEDNKTALMYAYCNKNLEITKCLLDNGRTAIMLCDHNYDITKELLDRGIDISIRKFNNVNIFMNACEHKKRDIINLLSDHCYIENKKYNGNVKRMIKKFEYYDRYFAKTLRKTFCK